MKDLTKNSITLHILMMAAPVAISMLAQVAQQVIALHFVSALGADAVVAVSSAANIAMVVGALAQILNVGTAALVAHRAGRKDIEGISILHNQSLGLACICALGTMFTLFGLAPLYMTMLSEDHEVVDAGVRFLWWASPGYALLLPMMVLNATLRGMGVIRAPMLIFTLTVVIGAALCIVLIPGYGFIPALGVDGAAIATSLSFAIGFMALWIYFYRSERGISSHWKLLTPRLDMWRRILEVGLPAAAELTLMFLSISVVYLVIRDQGSSAQAGFGIGFRILQMLLLPGLAVSIAAVPIAGQNFGARNPARVREVFRTTAAISAVLMLVTTILIQWQAMAILGIFDTDSMAAGTAKLFLQLMSWTLVAQGLVYTCAYMFQALGNTLPAMLSATARFVIFSVPAIWLSAKPDFRTEQVWYLLTASIAVQAALSWWLLEIEFKRKLQPAM